MLDDARSHGLWELTAPPAPETMSLQGAIKADIAIIGGGYTGLSAALQLAEAGVNVALLEAVEIGFGGSGRNVGLVNAGMWVMPDTLITVLGSDYGERLLQLLGDAPRLVFDLIERHHIDCDAERTGTLHCAVGPKGLKELERRAEQWSRRGAPVELLNAKDTQAKIGSPAYSGSLWDHRAGTIQPLAYARGLALAALNAGAQIFTRSAVTSLERIGGKWQLRTADGSVLADKVIVATNVYTTGPWSVLTKEQTHLPFFNFATRRLSSHIRKSILPEGQGAWDTNQVLSAFRYDRSGRLVFGSVGALRGTGTAVHRSWAKRALKKVFPQIGDVAFEAEWYGLIGMTDDNLPRFHKLAENVISFSGYNGRGIAPGTIFGRVLAAHLLEQLSEPDLPLPATPLANAAFRGAKEVIYETGAQLVHFFEARL